MPTNLPPASWGRLPALAWLLSKAFTRNRLLAILAAPAALLTLLPYALRKTVYESRDRNGMVIFGRYRPVADVLLAIPFALLIIVVMFTAVGLVGASFGFIGLFVALIGVGGFVIGALSMSSASSLTAAVGPETPAGPRWTVMALAQRPGTCLSALLLTRGLIRSLPKGSTVVAVTGSDELAAGYARLGFVRGKGPRIYRSLRGS